MPTILQILGWRLFFYANEGNEPIHVHCRKKEKECKYWLHTETFDLEEAYKYRLYETGGKSRRSYSTILSTLNSNGRNFNSGGNYEKTS